MFTNCKSSAFCLIVILAVLPSKADGQTSAFPSSFQLPREYTDIGWRIKVIATPNELVNYRPQAFKDAPVGVISLSNESARQERQAKGGGTYWVYPNLNIFIYPRKSIQKLLKERSNYYEAWKKKFGPPENGGVRVPGIGQPELGPELFWVTTDFVFFSSEGEMREGPLKEIIKEQLADK